MVSEDLIPKLAALFPQVIHHADLSTSHKDQANAETIIERIFDVLVNLASFSSYDDKKHFGSTEVKENLCNVLLEQVKDPQQLTFLSTR